MLSNLNIKKIEILLKKTLYKILKMKHCDINISMNIWCPLDQISDFNKAFYYHQTSSLLLTSNFIEYNNRHDREEATKHLYPNIIKSMFF